ncbi:Salicylate/benzoate carboxyl methyltransferase [Heracleum sosnowskyi]|uniref:Salicylate/benzoate carboxyl methyltransferase n=1 Tax=Heracleum sosnowskyi TaxID=360622 RepID=A0AAD8HX81_9APIA|nr:Salicylate/benzoate carboxyl methyltransferase [Heracleum sosnowskyi]
MDLLNVLHMNAGNGEGSYANSSTVQKYVILKSEKVLQDTIKNFGTNGFPECFKLADLGCSNGPNTFLFLANALEYVQKACQKKNLKAPDEFQAFLNDLPNNDFNSVFKLAPPFYSKLENEKDLQKSFKCFIYGVPGSFYTRLFPSKSLHFVHSSYSVHWLSQVPEKLLDNNKGNIYIARASPPGVYEAYFNQFKRDFTTFLRMRSEEIIPDGRMSLHDLVTEGLLREKDIFSLNLPFYTPCIDELKTIIESESSFCLDKLETFEVKWDMHDEDEIIKSKENSGNFIAKTTRVVMESLLASHFGSTFMDKIFERFAKHVTEHLSKGKSNYFSILVSLRRK